MATEIGKVVRFLPKISVAIIDLTGTLVTGETVTLQGKDGRPFQQAVGSMQIEHVSVDSAKTGESIGMKVDLPVAERSPVLKEA
jgi:putative protease